MRFRTSLILLAAFLLQGCFTAATTGANAVYKHYKLEKSIRDQLLAFKIQQTINQDEPLKYEARINITCVDDVTLLTGQTPTRAMHQRLIHYVKQTEGVIRLLDHIEIKAPIDTYQQLEDSWITAKIKSQIIAAREMDPDNVKVITEDKIVYLVGTMLRSQAEQVVNIAKTTQGVKKVVTVLYYLDKSTH